MDADRMERLTDQQRECLRLVYAHLSSKEIAPRLGVEPGTVDQYIKAAMRILGVADRRAAARMLAEHEAKGSQPLVYQTLDIAVVGDPAMFGPSTEGGRQYGATKVEAMREEQSVFEAAPSLRPGGFQLPLPIRGGRPSDLNSWHRLGWILAVMLMIAFMFGVFLAGLEALSRLGRLIAS